ncbi:MAG: hypothetical protein WAR37_00945 [Candidatus Microsaccharimonas sp.]
MSTTTKQLDVSVFPQEQHYVLADGTVLEMKQTLETYYEVFQQLVAQGLLNGNDNFGFAMAKPVEELDFKLHKHHNKPDKFVWFVGGWGPNRDRYIANAIRKMRPLLRPEPDMPIVDTSTLDFRFNDPKHFRKVVDSEQEEGVYQWGDFPYGGAVLAQYGPLILIGATSGFTEMQDDMVTRMILGGLGEQIVSTHGWLQ